ncbi:MAG: hypothetical protein K2O14_04315 [Oscillospiraceae bacterium]|nr:hypothetical protein [Oscillospiraceae bacterium]
MRFFSLYRVELRRLLLTRFIWLISALSLCSPLLGYTVYKPVTAGAMSGLYIGNPVLAGTAAGAVLWAVIAIVEGNRQRRSGTDILAEAIAPPVAHSAAKAAALVTISSIVTALCSLVYLPYTAIKLDYLFNAGYYFAHFLVLMLPTWWISILFAESIYRITRRVELSALIYAALAYMSFSRFTRNKYLLQWLNPILGSYSDGFPDIWFLRMGAYSRLMWLCAAAGLWAFSLMCQRRYQKGLFGSFAKSLKKVYLPISAAFLIASGTVLWNVQPFIGHGGEEFILENEYLYMTSGVTSVNHFIKFNPAFGTLSGRAEYNVTTPVKGESVFRLNAGYNVKSITYDGEPMDFRTVREDVNGQYDTYFELPEKDNKKLIIEYGGFPTVAQCMMPSVKASIGENYIYLSHTDIAPLLKNYGLAYGTVGLEVTMPDDLTPFIYFEPLTEFDENGDGTRTYKTRLDIDYIYNFVAGNYVMDQFSSSENINFNFIYGDIYSSVVDEYNVRQSICEVYDYCTRHYGRSPFTAEGVFKLFQRSSIDQGGFAVSGASTWPEDTITPNTLSDPNRGANAVEIFIHEMIHQWWGGVGMWCDDSDGLWSAEGLTVYSTYRLIKEKYGELYANQYYVDDWKRCVDEQDRNFYNRHPEYLEKLPESYQELIRVSNSDINYYKRMPLMILKAEELVGGEEKMDEILSKMYSDYNNVAEQYPVSYKTFLDYCGLTEEDLELD